MNPGNDVEEFVMILGKSWWSGNGHKCFEVFKTIVACYGLKLAWFIRNRKAIMPIHSGAIHVFVAIPGLPWEIVDNRNLPSMRIQYEYLKMSYGYRRVGLRLYRWRGM